jgi:hypothetical protein
MLLLIGSGMALLLLSPTSRATIISWLQGFDSVAGGASMSSSSTTGGTGPLRPGAVDPNLFPNIPTLPNLPGSTTTTPGGLAPIGGGI